MRGVFGAPTRLAPELAIEREAAHFLLPAPAPGGDNGEAHDCLAKIAGAAGRITTAATGV